MNNSNSKEATSMNASSSRISASPFRQSTKLLKAHWRLFFGRYCIFWVFYILLVIGFFFISNTFLDTQLWMYNPRLYNDEKKGSWKKNIYDETFRGFKGEGVAGRALWKRSSVFEINGYLQLKQYPDGLHLEVSDKSNRTLKKNSTIMDIPGLWVISYKHSGSYSLNQRLSRDVASGVIDQKIALMSSLLYEVYLGKKSHFYSLIECLPSFEWSKKNGLFSWPADKVEIMLQGTSAIQFANRARLAVEKALNYLNKSDISSLILQSSSSSEIEIKREKVEWAYSVCAIYSLRLTESLSGRDEDGIMLPPHASGNSKQSLHALFLPLIFVRRTPMIEVASSRLEASHNSEAYTLVCATDLPPGSEVVLYQPGSGLATSSLFFRGLWLGGEIAAVSLNFPIIAATPELATIESSNFGLLLLFIYGCIGDAAEFHIMKRSALNYQLLSCLRLWENVKQIARDGEAWPDEKLADWLKDWPYTVSLGRGSDIQSVKGAVRFLQNLRGRILKGNQDIKLQFAKELLSNHPLLQIRQLEYEALSDAIEAFQSFDGILQNTEMYTSFVSSEVEFVKSLKFLWVDPIYGCNNY